MTFEQYFNHGWKQVRAPVSDSEKYKGCFDCNICLEFASEPVVTLCGHLYCWPCIYKWLFVQSASLSHDEPPQCPVCKADISHTKMVPLYGRGQSADEAEHEETASLRRKTIPPRPAACNRTLTSTIPNNVQQLPYRNPYQNQNFDSHEEESASSMVDFGGTSINGFHYSTVGMIGNMVYARVFGNTHSLYPYPNSYQLMGNNTPRLRRLEVQADKSLNRISLFFFFCFLLCLIVF